MIKKLRSFFFYEPGEVVDSRYFTLNTVVGRVVAIGLLAAVALGTCFLGVAASVLLS